MTLLESLTAQPPPLHTDEDGVVRVGGTRVTLDTVIGAFNNGCAAEEIVLKYPSLKLTDVYAVITYYLWYRQEIDTYLEERRRQATELQEQIEARFPSQGIRERLLARRSQQP
jgi:uncharacterized protein (DUF433 family)